MREAAAHAMLRYLPLTDWSASWRGDVEAYRSHADGDARQRLAETLGDRLHVGAPGASEPF